MDRQRDEEVKTGTSLDQPVGMSSVDFHTTYQQDGPTVSDYYAGYGVGIPDKSSILGTSVGTH